MNKNAYILAAIIVAALILVGLRFFTRGATAPAEVTPAETIREETTPAATAGATMMEKEVQVSYSDSGFSLAGITVKSGTTVVFTNNSGKQMWVASAIHPMHQELPGFDQLKSVEKGDTYSYTFAKVGSWRYHNHVAPGDRGVVVVE